MSHELYLNSKEQATLYISQAIMILQAGMGVAVDDIVIFSSDTVNLLLLEQLKQHAPNLKVLISASRANYLFNMHVNYPLEIDFVKQENFLADISLASNKLDQNLYIIKKARANANEALILAQLAYLIPNLLIFTKGDFAIANLWQVYAQDIKNYKKNVAASLKEVARTKLILKNASETTLVNFKSKYSNDEHYALLIGSQNNTNPLVRLHSSCFTGDVLGSLYCDCGSQLQAAIKYISNNGGGVLLYIVEEGRNIGLVNKMRSYNLQQNNFDTVEANHILGFNHDDREFFAGAFILENLGIKNIRLLSNNPAKANALKSLGINVTATVPHHGSINAHNLCYLKN